MKHFDVMGNSRSPGLEIPSDPELMELAVTLEPNGLTCDAIDAFVRCLAAAALALWPRWWESPSSEKKTPAPGRHETWAKRAAALAQDQKLPLPTGFRPEQHADQLSLALFQRSFFLRAHAPEFPDQLARALSWFESHACARVFYERSQTNDGALERRFMSPPRVQSDGTCGNHSLWVVPDSGIPAGWSLKMGPLAGRPHPLSPGEQKLAGRIAADSALAGAFQYNVSVTTKFGRRYMVDLFHQIPAFIVEIDGFQHHNTRKAFFADRHRDYEFLVSGFPVLRIDHDEILRDLESAIAKIHDVLLFLQH